MFCARRCTTGSPPPAPAGAFAQDGVIAAHDRYLDSVLQKVLLGEKSQLLLRQLTTIFDVVLRFRAVCDRLYEQVATQLLSELSVDQAADFCARLDGIAADYSTLLEGFLNLLPVQKHVDLRTLLFRLDFSEYYSSAHKTTFVTPAPKAGGALGAGVGAGALARGRGRATAVRAPATAAGRGRGVSARSARGLDSRR